MTSAETKRAGNGLLSKLFLVILLALAIGLYLQVVTVDTGRHGGETAPRASLQVLEGDEPGIFRPAAQGLVDLPPDQMRLIIEVFAPEMLQD